MTLSTGSLNRRIIIEREIDTPNGQGGFDRTWGIIRHSWAQATPVAGKEALLNGTLRAIQPWRLEVRYNADLTVKDRIRMDCIMLGIQSIADLDGKRRSQVLFCQTEQG
jgi:head-tail adaptor